MPLQTPVVPTLKRAFATITSSMNAAADEHEMVVSTINTDRDGDRVLPEGGDFAAFLQNPVLMWAHGSKEGYAAIPIGTVTSLNVQDGQHIRATFRFLENDPFADRIANAYGQGVIRGASIGFQPVIMTPNGKGVDHEAWRLLEISLCSVPANAEAVRTMKSLGLSDEEASAPEAKALGLMDKPEPESAKVDATITVNVNADSIKAELASLRAELDAVQKRGRVLSAVNESRLRAAMDALANANGVLTEVLAQLMPMEPIEDEDHPKPGMEATHPDDEEMDPKKPHKPKPMMAIDAPAAYSLQLAEDQADEDGPVLRLMFAEDDASIVTLVDARGQEPVFAVDPVVMRQVVSDVVKEQLHASLIAPVGDLIQRALDKARGRVQ